MIITIDLSLARVASEALKSAGYHREAQSMETAIRDEMLSNSRQAEIDRLNEKRRALGDRIFNFTTKIPEGDNG
jgi:hypothetical protein